MGSSSTHIPSKGQSAQALPLELLHRIVDTICSGADFCCPIHSLGRLSLTCHSLAAYCRPLIFHTITLQSYPSSNRNVEPTHSTGARGAVATFVKRLTLVPPVSDFVQRLHIDLDVSFKRDPYFLESPLPNAAWLTLFEEKPFSNLRVLKISLTRVISGHEDHYAELWAPLLNFLHRTQTVEELIINVPSIFYLLDLVRDYAPRNLKHLHIKCGSEDYLLLLAFLAIPCNPATSTPKLESLSILSDDATSQGCLPNDYLDAFKFNTSELKHFQLDVQLPPSKFQRLQASLAGLFGRTLQCLHLHEPMVPDREQHPAFDLQMFPHLRCLEIWYHRGEKSLRSMLRWISASIEQSSLSHDTQLKDLSISLLGRKTQAVGIHRDAWDKVCEEMTFKNLKGVRVLSYVARVWDLDSSENVVQEVVPLGTYGEGDTTPYHKLWEKCACSGWVSNKWPM